MCLSGVCILAVAYAADGQKGALKHYVRNVFAVSCPCRYAASAPCLYLVESLCRMSFHDCTWGSQPGDKSGLVFDFYIHSCLGYCFLGHCLALVRDCRARFESGFQRGDKGGLRVTLGPLDTAEMRRLCASLLHIACMLLLQQLMLDQ